MGVRYAVYYTEPPGPLARWGAGWLGWDAAAGRAVPHPRVPGLPRPVSELTDRARRYGFHATLKPPFRLAAGAGEAALAAAVAELAGRLAPARCAGLRLGELDGFLALLPAGPAPGIAALAAEVVRALEGFRAPPAPGELARRRAAGLSRRQEASLRRWGYPHVLDDFRFHMTLSCRLPDPERAAVRAALERALPPLPAPFSLDALTLLRSDAEGRFHVLARHPLGG